MGRLIFIAVLVAFVGVLAVANWFQPVIFPDTSGYIELARGPNPWGEARHPLYGWMLIGLERLGLSQSAVPAVQLGLHASAVLALFAAARAWGLEAKAALALALAALINQALVIWGRAVLPEMPAISFMLLALSATLMAARGTRFWLWASLAMLGCGLACTLRPILLPALILLPLLFMLLACISGTGWNALRALGLAALLAVPILGQATYRLAKVGDFGLVSFGGLGSMGMTAQILTPDLVARLPESQRPLAEQFIAAKGRAVAEQKLMPLVRNSVGERSFQTTALDAFDVLARNFDDLVWTHAMNLRQPGEPWVAFNARLGALSSAVLRAAPERMVMWQTGAFSRLIGRLFAYNAAFLLALAAFSTVALVGIARHGTALGGSTGMSWTPLVLIVGSWTVLSTALSVLGAFPALRYTDTGGMLLAALPLYGVFLGLTNTNRDAPK
jgi:hypothetical protein